MKPINKEHKINNLKTISHGTAQIHRHQRYTATMYSKRFCTTPL